MVDVGTQDTTVDTQRIKLTNLTDSKTYVQVTITNFDIDSTVEKNELTNGTVDNVFSLYMNSIEGIMRVTTPEWADLVTLTTDVNGVRPKKIWSIAWTDDSGNTVTTSFLGQLKTLKTNDINPGKLNVFYRIETDESITVV